MLPKLLLERSGAIVSDLTKSELELLDALSGVQGGKLVYDDLKPAKRAMVRRMRIKGLLSKRAFAKGLVEATDAGRRAQSRRKVM